MKTIKMSMVEFSDFCAWDCGQKWNLKNKGGYPSFVKMNFLGIESFHSTLEDAADDCYSGSRGKYDHVLKIKWNR